MSSEVSTPLENAAAVQDWDLPATCDIQVLELLARLDNHKDTIS